MIVGRPLFCCSYCIRCYCTLPRTMIQNAAGVGRPSVILPSLIRTRSACNESANADWHACLLQCKWQGLLLLFSHHVRDNAGRIRTSRCKCFRRVLVCAGGGQRAPRYSNVSRINVPSGSGSHAFSSVCIPYASIEVAVAVLRHEKTISPQCLKLRASNKQEHTVVV